MTQISGIDCVSFYVDEKPLTDVNGKMVGTMYAESFVENPGEQINTIQNTNLTLYFSNQAGDGLVKETRRVHYSSNISLEKTDHGAASRRARIEEWQVRNSFGNQINERIACGWGMLCQL